MRNATEHIETLYNRMKDYTETSVKLYKLQAIDVIGEIVANIIVRVAFVFVLAMFLLFLNIGLGFYLGKILNSYYIGFILVSSIYLLVGFILYLLRYKLIRNRINDLIISHFQSFTDNNINQKIKDDEELQ